MVVIGADAQKGSHALAAVDDGTGKVRGSRQIKAEVAGHLAAAAGLLRLTRSRSGESPGFGVVGRKHEEVDHGERRGASEEGDATPQGRETCFGLAPLR